MTRVVLDTLIQAPIDVCFDLARDVEAHVQTADFTDERVVPPGRTSGRLERGDLITFEGVHLGVRQRLTARIVEMNRPARFADEMVRGAFRRLRHTHEFLAQGSATLMRDTLEWEAPLGPLGWLADRLFLVRHMRSFLVRKQTQLKALAEAQAGRLA